MKKFAFLLSIFLFFVIISDAQNSKTVTFKLKITNHLPVGWGDKYEAVILDVVEGSRLQFGDTIVFGKMDFSGKDYFTTGDIRTVCFKNTHEKNKYPYLPAGSLTVSILNEIWEIVSIKK